MKKNYVDGLVTGSDFDDFFLLKSMAVRVGSNQKKYIDMILSDKTGDVSAKKWDASDTEIAELESYGENAIIKIRASVTEWQGKQQLKVSRFRQAAETMISISKSLSVPRRRRAGICTITSWEKSDRSQTNS